MKFNYNAEDMLKSHKDGYEEALYAVWDFLDSNKPFYEWCHDPEPSKFWLGVLKSLDREREFIKFL